MIECRRRVFLILAGMSACCPFVARSAERPNLVFIIADDCTFRDLECYGGQAQTPHINRLATEGDEVHPVFPGGPDVLTHST